MEIRAPNNSAPAVPSWCPDTRPPVTPREGGLRSAGRRTGFEDFMIRISSCQIGQTYGPEALLLAQVDDLLRLQIGFS